MIQAKRSGVAPPDSSVQGVFASWCGSSGCNTGLTMARFYKSGLDGYKPGCFGPVAKSQTAHQQAIDKYHGFIAGQMGAHEVAAVGYDAANVYFVSSGVLTSLPWAKWLSMVDASTYAFSDVYDSSLAGGMWWYLASWFGSWL